MLAKYVVPVTSVLNACIPSNQVGEAPLTIPGQSLIETSERQPLTRSALVSLSVS